MKGKCSTQGGQTRGISSGYHYLGQKPLSQKLSIEKGWSLKGTIGRSSNYISELLKYKKQIVTEKSKSPN